MLLHSGSALQVRGSEYASCYAYLRSQINSDEEGAFASPIAALRKLNRELPAQIKLREGSEIAGKGNEERIRELYWRTIDAYVLGASGVADLAARSGSLPPMIGGYLPAHSAMSVVKQAIEEATPIYRARIWPKVQEDIEKQCDFWRKHAGEEGGQMVRLAQTALGLQMPKQVDVLVTGEGAGKEGMTIRTLQGLRIVVSAAKYRGADFVEVIVHELIHAMDATTAESFLHDLRTSLKAKGTAQDRIDQLVHGTIFVAAAELVRIHLDAKHKDVGEIFGAYDRGLRWAVNAVASPVSNLISGKWSRDEALKAIVETVES